ncbi:MAG: superoxide dismutase [Anaerolineaceae bacterium]
MTTQDVNKPGNPLGTFSPVELPKLPFADNALEPVISANTISFHYGKHHKTYVDNLVKLVAGTDLEGHSLEEIIAAASKDGKQAIFNNAAQAWNHNFYWQSLTLPEVSKIPVELEKIILASFESVDELKKQFTAAALGQFGSGWAWLVWDGAKLAIDKTPNAMVPWLDAKKPVLTVDVWEHAYYLDYQNRRQAYVEAVLDKIINWEFALKNIKG